MFDNDVLKKWKRAVVHIDGITEKGNGKFKAIVELNKKLDNTEISKDEFQQEFKEIMKQISRQLGTAIFLEHNNKRFLLTARHVVFDEERVKFRAKTDTKGLDPKVFDNTIVNQIFRVLSFDEMQSFLKVDNDTPEAVPKYIPKSLFIMNIGSTELRPYTFNNELDLALISLDRDDVDVKNNLDHSNFGKVKNNFADELIKCGYKPISTYDISNEPKDEGVEVFTVGFPGAVAIFDKLKELEDFNQNLSPYYSLPNFSFGNVSMLHPPLPYFWVDLSIYPGNSGGPIIENNKLVGIISGQPTIPSEGSINLGSNSYDTITDVEIPFGKIIKSKYVFELLQTQEESDKKRDQFISKINEMKKKREKTKK